MGVQSTPKPGLQRSVLHCWVWEARLQGGGVQCISLWSRLLLVEAWCFPKPAPPCVSPLSGQVDPCCEPSLLCLPSVQHSSLWHSTLLLLALSLHIQCKTLPLASVVWGHCFHGEDAGGKDAILLRLLAKFPVEWSFSSFPPTTSIQGLSLFPAPPLGGTWCHVDVPSCL